MIIKICTFVSSLFVLPLLVVGKIFSIITIFHILLHWTREIFNLLIYSFWYLISQLFPFDLSGVNFGRWVIVTGGSEGIGRAYVEAFCKRGKYVLILARTVSKMEKVKVEMEKKYGEVGCQVDYLSVDFSQAVETYLPKLRSKLNETRSDNTKISDNIGILINCVGMLPYAYDTFWGDRERRLKEKPNEDYTIRCQKQLNINCLSQLAMTAEILPLMRNKPNDGRYLGDYKGIIISLSSFTGRQPIPFWGTYTACKGFNLYFSDSLARENIWSTNDIIFQTQHPMEVTTSMAPTELPSLRAPRPEDYVESALKTVGWMRRTCGWYFHEIRCVMSEVATQFGIDYVNANRYKAINKGRIVKRTSNLKKISRQLSRTLSDSLGRVFGAEEAKSRKKLDKSKRFFF